MNHINYLNKENFIYGDGFKGLNINISSNMDYIVNKINNIK